MDSYGTIGLLEACAAVGDEHLAKTLLRLFPFPNAEEPMARPDNRDIFLAIGDLVAAFGDNVFSEPGEKFLDVRRTDRTEREISIWAELAMTFAQIEHLSRLACDVIPTIAAVSILPKPLAKATARTMLKPSKVVKAATRTVLSRSRPPPVMIPTSEVTSITLLFANKLPTNASIIPSIPNVLVMIATLRPVLLEQWVVWLLESPLRRKHNLLGQILDHLGVRTLISTTPLYNLAEARLSELELVPFISENHDWRRPDAICVKPEVQRFLRGPQREKIFNGFKCRNDAKSFAALMDSKIAVATATGNSTKARVTVTKKNEEWSFLEKTLLNVAGIVRIGQGGDCDFHPSGK